MTQIRATVRMRRTVEAVGSGGVGAVEGPFVAWCRKPWPSGDDKTLVFALHNLPANAIVAWSLAPAAEFVEIVGPSDAHVLVVKSQGSSGSVSATVNGESIGSMAFDYGDCDE